MAFYALYAHPSYRKWSGPSVSGSRSVISNRYWTPPVKVLTATKRIFFYSISNLTHLSLCQSTMFLKVFLAILIVKTWPFYFLYLRFLFVKSFLCLLYVLSKKKPSFWMVHIELWCTKLNNWNTISWYKTQLYQVMTIAC